MTMRFWKLTGNSHTDHETGRVLKRGDTFESDKDMDTLYPNKFQEIPRDPKQMRQAGVREQKVTNLEGREESKFVDVSPEGGRRKVKGHGRDVKDEEIDHDVMDSPSEEVERKKAVEDRIRQEVETEVRQRVEAEEEKRIKREQDPNSDFGDDVSGEFEAAERVGLQVYKHGETGKFSVIDPDRPGERFGDEHEDADGVDEFLNQHEKRTKAKKSAAPKAAKAPKKAAKKGKKRTEE